MYDIRRLCFNKKAESFYFLIMKKNKVLSLFRIVYMSSCHKHKIKLTKFEKNSYGMIVERY